jgi:hypothetical protein
VQVSLGVNAGVLLLLLPFSWLLFQRIRQEQSAGQTLPVAAAS